jgi:hypothetical protein
VLRLLTRGGLDRVAVEGDVAGGEVGAVVGAEVVLVNAGLDQTEGARVMGIENPLSVVAVPILSPPAWHREPSWATVVAGLGGRRVLVGATKPEAGAWRGAQL